MKNFFNKYVRLPLWLVITVALAVSSYALGRVLEYNYSKRIDYAEKFVHDTKHKVIETWIECHPWTIHGLSPETKYILYHEVYHDTNLPMKEDYLYLFDRPKIEIKRD